MDFERISQQEAGRAYRMRCPNCRKDFSVEGRHFIGVVKPLHFGCDQCSQVFAALAPQRPEQETLDTISVNQTPAPKRPTSYSSVPEAEQTRSCPNCGSSQSAVAKDCETCGVIFSRFRPDLKEHIEEVRLAGGAELVELWADVMSDPERESNHERFVDACNKSDSLTYAAQKYTDLLAGAPNLEIAQRMRKRVVGFASARFETSKIDVKSPARFPSFKSFILLMGTITLGMGIGFPNMASLTGMGLAMIALSFGLRGFVR